MPSPSPRPIPNRNASVARAILRMAFLSASLLAAACDSGSGPPPLPASISGVDGNGQSATVGTPVPIGPSVRVLNKKGKPIARQEVVFSVTAGGGQITGGVQTTDNSGLARVERWVLGTTAGPNALQASVPGLDPVTFEATGSAGAPTTVVPVEGDGQTGVVGAPLPMPPAVRVRDTFQNPVPGVTVAFQVATGGGDVEVESALTDAEGVARAGAWTLGTTPGSNTLLASVAGLAPVGFSATGEADAPAQVTAVGGEGQVGTVGTELPQAPAVEVADQYGNLLQGVPVVFAVMDGGGAIANGNATTDPSGVATAGTWTLGTAAGSQSLSATVSGLEPVTIQAMATAADPATAQAQAGASQTGTVGEVVSLLPAVLVQDPYGNPVAGVTVLFVETGHPDAPGSVEEDVGGPSERGVLSGDEATTGPDGIASVESWILGQGAGTYELTAFPDGLETTVVFRVEALPDVPSDLVKASGDGQSAQAGAQLPVPPSVRVSDRYGNGVPGVAVEFVVTEGEGSVEGAAAVTGLDGTAAVGTWTLGPAPGANRMTASVAGLGTVAFQATGLAALPAALVKVAGDNQTGSVGATVAVPPRVRVVDSAGGPVPSVEVVFTVGSGQGTISGSSLVTGADGLASVGSWALGTAAGTNTLIATVAGVNPVVFSATGRPGEPSSMVLHGGDGQSATVNTPVATPPSVLLTDEFGNRVSGAAVTFTVTGGGGAVAGSPALTNAWGIAAVTAWTLGPGTGVNTLSAHVPGLPDVVFDATALATPPVGAFTLDLQFMTSIDPSQEAVFHQAAARWEEVIVGDIPDYGGTLSAGACQPVDENDGIDDVKIYVSVLAIDGEGGILGQAGPCYVWDPTAVFPITGIMRLDEADLATMQANGTLRDVIIHEMGHVLGFGTLWSAGSNDLLVDGETSDPYFDGVGAVAAFDLAGGADRPGPKVPVENTGGVGTRNAHWRESVHNSELMTGWIEAPGTPNPLSAITVASLADLGYAVDMGAADSYVLYDPLAAFRMDAGLKVFLNELPPPTPIPVGPGGGGKLP